MSGNYLFFLPVVAIIFGLKFRLYYQRSLNNFMAVCDDIRESKKEIAPRNIGLIFFLSLLSLIPYVTCQNVLLCLFVFFFSLAAYTDLQEQWIPDELIYVMTWLSACNLFVNNPNEVILIHALTGAVFYGLFLMLNVFSKRKVIEDGDMFLIFPLCVFMSPISTYIFVSLAVIVCFIHSKFRRVKVAPFVPYLFFPFLLMSVIDEKVNLTLSGISSMLF